MNDDESDLESVLRTESYGHAENCKGTGKI